MPGDYVQFRMEETPRYEDAPLATPFRLSTNLFYLPVTSVRVAANPTFEDRSDEVRNIEGGVPQIVDRFEPDGSIAIRVYANALPFVLSMAGWVGVPTTGAGGGTNEVQSIAITGAPTGGSYTLTFTPPDGAPAETTVPIAWNATAAVVQAALEGLRYIRIGDVTCAGGPHPATPVTVTFTGRLAARNIAQITGTGTALTPSGGVNPTTTTPGVAGTVADPDGATIPATATRWVFTKRGGRFAKTAQILLAYDDEAAHFVGQGYGITNLTLNADGDMTGEMAGLVFANVADPSLTPTIDVSSILPALRGDFFLTWLSGGGSVEDFSIAISNPLERRWTLGLSPSSRYPDLMEHAAERVRVTGSIPKTIIDDDDINTLLAGTPFAGKARWQTLNSNIAATSYPYSVWIEMPKAQYLAATPDDLSNARRFGASFDFWAAWDESLGYDAKITVVNAVPAIETYP